VYYRWWSN